MAMTKDMAGVARVALVAALAFLAFAPCLGNDFVYDDVATLKANVGLRKLLSPAAYFRRDYFRLAREASYRPLATATYAMDYRIWGQRPIGYHLGNLLWHCAASILFFALCRSLGAFPPVATLAAALYAAHPIQSESVCCISYREDLMCASFYLAALALWPPAAGRATPPARRSADQLRFAASMGCLVLALLSKEMALSFPLLAMAKEWRAARRSGEAWGALWKRRAGRLALPWAIALAAFAVFTTFHPSGGPLPGSVYEPPLLNRMAAFAYVCARYLWLLVVPYPLCADYVIALEGAPLWAAAAGAWIALIGLGAAAYGFRRRFPAGLEALVGFVLLLVPVSGIINLFHPMALRYLALPSAAFCWLLAHAVGALGRRGLARSVMGALLAGCVAVSWVRAGDWRSEEALWSCEIRFGSRSAVARNNLGLVMAKAGKIDEAIPLFGEAVRLKPNYATAHMNLGVALGRRGDVDQAIAHLTEALKYWPDFAEARYNLGYALYLQGRRDEAIRLYRQALATAQAQGATELAAIIQTELDRVK